MEVKSTATFEELLEELQNDITNKNNDHQLVFVNGKLYEGLLRYKELDGFGWESGRTISVILSSPIDPSSEVYLVDLKYLRLRKCVLVEKPSLKGKQEWEAIDLPEDRE